MSREPFLPDFYNVQWRTPNYHHSIGEKGFATLEEAEGFVKKGMEQTIAAGVDQGLNWRILAVKVLDEWIEGTKI